VAGLRERGDRVPGTLRGVTGEVEALQWLSVDELAATRRQAIKKLNLLDRSAADHAVTAAAVERTIDLIGEVQAARRHDR
jgi:hypothetical protein